MRTPYRIHARQVSHRGIPTVQSRRPTVQKVGRMVGRETKKLRNIPKKSGARLASPQPRPASPVNGAGGITGCRNDSRPKKSFQQGRTFFQFFREGGGWTTKLWGSDGVDRPPMGPRRTRNVTADCGDIGRSRALADFRRRGVRAGS